MTFSCGVKKIRIKSFVLVGLGACVMCFGICMASAKRTEMIESTIKDTTPSTKGRNAAIGAGIGAVGGGVLAAVIGGVGIVACGTGIGLPAGAALIVTAAVLGGAGGAVTGAATGTSSSTSTVTTWVPHIVPAHSPLFWIPILVIGVALLIFAFWDMKRAP